MNKQQTAVEWLINELQKTRDYQRVINEANQSSSSVRDVIKQALQMEKEQHENTWDDSFLFKDDWEMKFEQYYQETYGGNK